MEYGLIKDTTLRAMADGLRAKGLIKKVLDYELVKSSNATSFTDPTPVTSGGIPNMSYVLSEATTMELEITLGVHPTVTNTSAAYVYVYSDEYYSKLYYSIPVTKDNHGTVHKVSVPSNSCVFVFSAGSSAVVFKAYPFDEDGNPIKLLRDADENTTVTPSDMVEAVNSMLPALPEEAFMLNGDLQRVFSHNKFAWYIDLYGDNVTTSDVSNLYYTFYSCRDLTRIPFTINVKDAYNLGYCFNDCRGLTESPKIRGVLKFNTSFDVSYSTHDCHNVRDFEDLFEPSMLDGFSTVKVTSSYSPPKGLNFVSCYSLRRIPSWWYKFRLNEESTAFPYAAYAHFPRCFNFCHALDEIKDIPVWKCQAPAASNLFNNATFSGTSRVKSITFETIDGQPIIAQWKSQTIDLSNAVGYASDASFITNYNSGITADKQVTDDATYQALKNDPDWFTKNVAYSRYNHDSAVETINSLPDTKAYITSAGGTNTIMFKKASGSLTDGGAIETLTPEEIAIADNKGWTIAWA